MSTLLIIWFILSFLLESIVTASPGDFVTSWKHVLFYVLTAPTILWSKAQDLVGKLVSLPLAAKLSSWFKS